MQDFKPPLYGLALALCLWPRLGLGASFGSTSGLLMAEGLAVRPLGAAFAFTALSDDEDSLQVNPAGLASLNGLALSGGHVLGLLGTQLSYLDMGYSRPEIGALGLQAAYFGDSDTQRDDSGNAVGSFDDTQVLLGLGVAKEWLPGWRLGLQAKGLQESYAGQAANSFAGDLGLQGPLPHGWQFGLAVLNAGQQWGSSDGDSFATPLQVQGGVAFPFFIPAWKIEADLQGLPNEGQARLLLGTELKIDVGSEKEPTRLALRGGTQTGLIINEDPRLYLGAGIELLPNYALDYALLDLGNLGLTHRFSLSLRFLNKPNLGPPAADLSAPFDVKVLPQIDGLLVTWSDSNKKVAGYNLYSDYGVLVEKLNAQPVKGHSQRFVKVTRSRTYNFYVRPVGSDGKEGPASEVCTWVVP